MKNKLKDKLIKLLKEVECVQFGDFTLASGKKSNYYVNIKKATTNPKILKTVAQLINIYIEEDKKKSKFKNSRSRVGLCFNSHSSIS